MFLGLSIITWIRLAPRVVALIKFFVAVAIGYSVINGTDPVTSFVELLERLRKTIPHPKKFSEWDKSEIDRWYKSAGGNNDDPNYGMGG